MHGLRPELARDAAEFVGLMRQLKERSGCTYRQLEEKAAASGDVLARSTIADVLRRQSLPRPELLVAFVRACGDGDRVEVWLRAWNQIAGEGPAIGVEVVEPAKQVPAARKGLGVSVLVASVVGAVMLVAAGAWVLAASDEPPGDGEAVQGMESMPAGGVPALPNGWVRIRPVTAPRLCLTDGRVRDQRYVPLVAVQRPCEDVAPQSTMLEPMGGDLYRIQWHHPDYGKGCLKALTDGPGAGLLEPIDDCSQFSQFHLEPSEPYGSNSYVLRVGGQGCVGIRGSDVSEGTEAVMERCVGRGGQIFIIEVA